MALPTRDDPLGLRTYDKDLAELNVDIDNCLGQAESSKAFLEAVSGGRSGKAGSAPSSSASQSKLLLNNPRALVSGAIPDGPETPIGADKAEVSAALEAQPTPKPKSKVASGAIVATQSTSSSKVSTSVTVITTTTTTKKTVEMIAAPQPPQPPPPATSERVVVLEEKPAAVQEAATPSVVLPAQDAPPSTVTEAIKTVAAFSNLANPPSKVDPAKERVSVKALQNEFHRDRMNDAVVIREALAANGAAKPDATMEEAGRGDAEEKAGAEKTDVDQKAKPETKDLPKEPAMASPAALLQKAKIEKQLHEEAKKRAEAAKAEELAKAAEKQRKKDEKKKKEREEKKKKAEGGASVGPETKAEPEESGPPTLAAADVELEVEREAPPAKDLERRHKKEKKHKKHKKDKEEKKKKKKHKEAEKGEEKEEKKKHKHKHKKEDDGKKKDGAKKKKKKAKKEHGSETKGEDFILDDEAEEVDEPLSDEEGSLDSEEEAAENASDDEPLADSDIEYLEESASDVDESGNIAGFVCDEIEYESGSLSEEPEEIHGRSEHSDYLNSGPRVYGKTKRLKKHSENEGKRHKKDKKHKKHRGDSSKTAATNSDVEEALIEESRAAGAPIPEARRPEAPAAAAAPSSASSSKKRRKNELSDDDIVLEDEKPKGAKLVPASIGRLANDLSRMVPLSKRPVNNLGAPVSDAELPMVIYKMLLSTAGFVLFTWHKNFDKEIKASTKLPSAPMGQQVSDFSKYVTALETGTCRMADQQCCSVFRSYFGHDVADVSAEDDESLSINSLAIRVIKELARIQLLPQDVAELFYDGTARPFSTQEAVATEEQPASEAERPVEYTLSVNYTPVLKSTTQKATADFLDKVFFWYRPVEEIHTLLERFVEREFKFSTLVPNDEGTEKCFTAPVVKSYDDIDALISTRFAAKHRDEIHALSRRIVHARIEALNLMRELRATPTPEAQAS